MKTAIWITHRDYEVVRGRETWDVSYYNSRELPLEPRKGLLNIKKDFAVPADVEKVTVRATALGVFRLYLNGKRVGQTIGGKTVYDELKPGWTDFNHRVFEFVLPHG